MSDENYVPAEERRSMHSPLFAALNATASPALIQCLLEEGAVHADAEDERDRLPLSIAMNRYKGDERVRVMRLLLDYGARVNRENIRCSTILHDASGECAVDIVRLLLRRGADVHVKNYSEREPLEMALVSYAWHHSRTIADNIQCIRLLLNAGATFTAASVRSTTELLDALYTSGFKPILSKSDIVAVCSLLVEHGARLTRAARFGVTYAHLAAQVDHVPLLHTFIAQGGNVNAVALAGRESRPLDEAIFYGSVHVARELLSLSDRDFDDGNLFEMKTSAEAARRSHGESKPNSTLL